MRLQSHYVSTSFSVGLWISSEVVGDAGVNHLGYYTCCWNTKAEAIAAHGFTGAIHMWKKVEDTLEPKVCVSINWF